MQRERTIERHFLFPLIPVKLYCCLYELNIPQIVYLIQHRDQSFYSILAFLIVYKWKDSTYNI